MTKDLLNIWYASDLHAEINGWTASDDSAIIYSAAETPLDVLVLAGDITKAAALRANASDASSRSIKKATKRLMDHYARFFRHIVVIAGNHEHYGSEYPWTIDALGDCYDQYSNVHFLENSWKDIEGVRFFGATMWTDYRDGNPLEMERGARFMNDFRQIYLDKNSMKRITPQYLLERHQDSRRHLNEALILAGPERPFVVVTHHSPSHLGIHPHFQADWGGVNSSYYSDLTSIMDKYPQIKYWIHGHTHYTYEADIYDTKVVANQVGYFRYEPTPYFQLNKILQVEKPRVKNLPKAG